MLITRNRRHSLRRSLAELQRLPERPQIVVVDNASTDGTADAIRREPDICLIELAANIGSAARTVGARAAGTPYVAFSDDDSWWGPGALSHAADVLDSNPDVALLAGRTLVGPTHREDPLNDTLARSPVDDHPRPPGPGVLGFLACAAVVRRSAFLAVGGFHPRYGVGGEENLLALDLANQGWRLCYVPEVVAHHHPAPAPWRAERAAQQIRNDIWTAWLRWRFASAARWTAAIAWRAAGDDTHRRALSESVRALPWVFRERSPVSRDVQRKLHRLRNGQPSGSGRGRRVSDARSLPS